MDEEREEEECAYVRVRKRRTGRGKGGGDEGEKEEEEEGWWFTSISECEVDPDSGSICCLETKLTIFDSWRYCFLLFQRRSGLQRRVAERIENSNLNEQY